MKRAYFALSLVFLSTVVHAKVATVSLHELVRLSDIILVGEVERVEVKAGVKVARVRSSQFIKGHAECPIAFVAEATWTCDISTAVPGEPVLLYLKSVGQPKSRTMKGQDLGAVQAACKREGVQLYVLSHSGRGRIRLSLERGRWVAPVTPGEGKGPGLNVNLYVPKPIPTVPTSSGQRAILLAELVQRTTKALDR